MFKKAIPVFAKDEENSLNYHLALYAELESLKDTSIYISAATFYRLYVNGTFVCTGPARTLWEYKQLVGSHDHGFASLAAIAIDFVEQK